MTQQARRPKAQPQPFTVRRLLAEDAEAFRAFRLDGLSRHPEAFGADFDEEAEIDISEWRRRLSDNAVFGAFRDDRLLATAAFYRESRVKMRHKAVLWGVYVAETARGQGLGRAVVEAAIAEARQLVAQLLTCVSVDNAPAQRLYEELGFRAWGLQPRSLKIGERFVDEIDMLLVFEDDANGS